MYYTIEITNPGDPQVGIYPEVHTLENVYIEDLDHMLEVCEKLKVAFASFMDNPTVTFWNLDTEKQF